MPARPTSRPRAARLSLILPIVTSFTLLVLAAFAARSLAGRWRPGPAGPALFAVRYGSLDPTVVVRGDLESAENGEVVCRVKARARNSTMATTLKWLIDDGTPVRKGQLVALLDDSELQDELQSDTILLEQARADWVQADENYKIITAQARGDVAAAEVAAVLAALDLKKYVEGDYEQSRKDIEGRLYQAEADVGMWRERSSWTEYMSRKGFATLTQVRTEQSKLQSAQVALDKVREESRVLRYVKERTLADLEGRLATARRDLVRVRHEAGAKEVQANVDRLSKRRIYEQRRATCAEIDEEIRKCTLTAPHDGLVVYYAPSQARSGSGSQQSIIAQGEPVREGQILMRIPDLTKMQVHTTIHEAVVSHLHGDVYRPTGFGECVQAGLLANADPAGRLLAQAAFPGLRTSFQKLEQRKVRNGQPAWIRMEAFPERVFRGHVARLAGVGAVAERGWGNVVVYDAYVALDETVDGIKPDLSAEVMIALDNGADDVLVVPPRAVVQTPGGGKLCTCYVQTPHGPEEREVTVGLFNDDLVEIKSGLEEGEDVLLNPPQP